MFKDTSYAWSENGVKTDFLRWWHMNGTWLLQAFNNNKKLQKHQILSGQM